MPLRHMENWVITLHTLNSSIRCVVIFNICSRSDKFTNGEAVLLPTEKENSKSWELVQMWCSTKTWCSSQELNPSHPDYSWSLMISYSGSQHTLVKVRGKAVPVHTTKAYRRGEIYLHSFLTLALEWGRGGTTNGQLHATGTLPPQKETHPVPTEQEAG